MKSNILLPYENKWVALTFDRTKVITSGKTYTEVDRKLKEMSIEDVILYFVLPFDRSYAPNGKKIH